MKEIFNEIESIENSWSLRELKRQFDSGLFERLKLSSDKQKVERAIFEWSSYSNSTRFNKRPIYFRVCGSS